MARYAALADPVRLRIMDLLTLGDAAPVELQAELGVSSSLLAHHLNQLEHAGLLLRTRERPPEKRIPIFEKVTIERGQYWRYPK